ncbi:DUF4625 domain-containing protein [Flavobacterium quisquiliarum]|uniref:DUF4625 domain-containing protein n=1 Tax=Flavobacterium quisquiliarum TaxID=1834436 RepID=A0ABV8W703_9FLAO|nr:DUF4625 domain-containing protein [Flavobacterium quisquiliarum]MBW1657305.1 DUF4625 domain-containing protein [Flavobacterium quisquiliarum]NWL01993.1 hypothetical protein [Flavobacterium collinsii]
MKKIKFLFGVLALAFISSCSSDNTEIDTEYPVIDITGSNAFPIQCSTIERGQTITFKATFNDNVSLGSYSLDIHHNFDHHTHSTEVTNCEMEAVKKPVKPMLFINNYTIPNGVKSYEATTQITIPADVDPGDYHFMIRLTDKEGWQTLKGLSIKIL